MNKNKIFPFLLLILIPVVLVFMSFFKSLHLAWGDAPYYYAEGLRELVGEPLTWMQKGVDFGGVNMVLWLSPIMAIYGALNKFLGFNNDVIIRVVFYFPSVILAVLGSYLLAKYLNFSKTVRFFATFLYVLNTYFILLIDGGQVGVALSYGIFPFVILSWKTFLDNLSAGKFVTAFLITSLLCYVDPRIAILSFLTIFLWQTLECVVEKKGARIKNLLWLVLAGIFLIPVNAFWLLPLINAGAGGLSTSVTELQLSSLLNSLFLFATHWPSNTFGKVVAPYFYFSFVPILVFGGFISRKIDKRYYIFALIFLLFAFLAKGSTPPIGTWYEIFVNRIPFGLIFRDSSKFFIPMFLLGGILIGNTVEYLSNLSKNTLFKSFIFGSVYLYLLFLIFPAILGSLNFNLSERRESEDYSAIYNHLRTEDDGFRTLWFNEKPQIAFETSGKPALSANQLVSYRPFASINEGEDAYNFLNNQNFPIWLRIFGIRYVMLSGDPRNIYPTEKDTANWSEEYKLISEANGLIKQNWGTQIPIYKIDDARPEVYSVKKLAFVVGPDLPLSDKIPTTIYAEDGKFDPNIIEKVNPDALSVVFNGGNLTDFAMSLLQKYFKSPAEAESAEWSRYDSGQYLKVKYELLIRGFKFRDFDYGRGLAFSTKKGEHIKYFFNIPEDANYVIAVRTATDKNQKLSWNIDKKFLKVGNYEVDVENSSELQVLNAVAVVPQFQFDDATKSAVKFVSKFGSASDLGQSISSWSPVVVTKALNLSKEFKVAPDDNWLIYTQSFDSDWGSDNKDDIHLPVFSMINGFYVDNENIKIDFKGQEYLTVGRKISFGFIILLLVSYLAYAIVRKFK